jgi:hypothetical protein
MEKIKPNAYHIILGAHIETENYRIFTMANFGRFSNMLLKKRPLEFI